MAASEDPGSLPQGQLESAKRILRERNRLFAEASNEYKGWSLVIETIRVLRGVEEWPETVVLLWLLVRRLEYLGSSSVLRQMIDDDVLLPATVNAIRMLQDEEDFDSVTSYLEQWDDTEFAERVELEIRLMLGRAIDDRLDLEKRQNEAMNCWMDEGDRARRLSSPRQPSSPSTLTPQLDSETQGRDATSGQAAEDAHHEHTVGEEGMEHVDPTDTDIILKMQRHPDKRLLTKDIAELVDRPPKNISKNLSKLKRLGFIDNIRRKGYLLTQEGLSFQEEGSDR